MLFRVRRYTLNVMAAYQPVVQACGEPHASYLHQIAYLPTPWSRVLLEKLTVSAASQEIPRIF